MLAWGEWLSLLESSVSRSHRTALRAVRAFIYICICDARNQYVMMSLTSANRVKIRSSILLPGHRCSRG